MYNYYIMWEQFMWKLVAWLDPKLEPYRKKIQAPKFTPKTFEEFVDVLRRTPRNILSNDDRARIAAVMGFEGRKVADLMTPKNEMVFVYEKDFLGPLTLDKLYRSGFTHFPVVDEKSHIKGIIHTDALNALEIKKTDRASKYLDKTFQFIHETETLKTAVEKMLKTNVFYFMVVNKNEELVGFFTIEMLIRYLVGPAGIEPAL